MKDLELIKFVVSKNKLEWAWPTRFTSGVINRVYDLGSHVIKIEGSDLTDYAKDVLKPQAALMERVRALDAKIPKVIDSGEFEGSPYILMEKAKGRELVYDWLNFNLKQKENFIAQICEQLQIFHSVKNDFYSIAIYQNKNFENLKGATINLTDFTEIDKAKLKKEYAEDIEYLEGFLTENIEVLNEQNTAVLTHNDIHLENVFYKDNKVTAIIDFDWVSWAPKDYELRKIVDVFYYPKNYMAERLGQRYEGYRMTEEFKFLKKYYPGLFGIDNLLTRVRLYNLENVIYKTVDYQKGKWSENVMIELHQQIKDFYQGGWLSEVLLR